MSGTLADLVRISSQLAEGLAAYYWAVVNRLDRTPWFRQGTVIPASAIAIPASVFKETTAADERDADDRTHTALRQLDPEIADFYEEPTGRQRREKVPWAHELPHIHRAVVLGAPGGGKSFLTQTAAIALARQALQQITDHTVPLDMLPLPIHLELAELATEGLPSDPKQAILAWVQARYGPPPDLLAWMEVRLRTTQCWLFLDALDQVDEMDRARLRGRLEGMDSQNWACHILLTCRTPNYNRQEVPWAAVTEYELAPFEPTEQSQFSERWFGAGNPAGQTLQQVLARNFALSHACRSPLVLTFACLAHAENGVTEETRRVDLYGAVLRNLIRRAWHEDPLPPNDPHIDDMARLLVAMGHTLFMQSPQANLFTDDQVIQAIQAAPTRPLPRVWRPQLRSGRIPAELLPYAPGLLRDELTECNILVNAGRNRQGDLQFSFAHRSLLEYLMAQALVAQGWPAIAPLVDKKAWDPAWRETILFLCALLGDPGPLLAMLTTPEPTATNPHGDDAFRHRLALAARCLGELSAERRQRCEDEVNRITDDAFGLWWQHRTEGTEDALEHLTRGLPALAAVNGRVTADLQTGRAQPLLDRLTELLRDEGEYVRWVAAQALGDMGAAAARPDLLDRLTELLRDEGEYVREAAAGALKAMGPAAARPDLLDRLTELLRDEGESVRRAAVWALGAMGPAAARPDRLAELLRDRAWYVHVAVIDALNAMGPAAARPALLDRLAELLRDGDWYVRWAAAGALKAMGPAAARPDTLDRLTELLRDEDRTVRRAADALGAMGPAAARPDLLDRLAELLRDEDRDVRGAAARALEAMGPAAARPDLLDRLTELLRDEGESVRRAAADALGAMGPAAARLDRLTELLRDEGESVRRDAARALGAMGPAAARPDTLDRLAELLRDEDESVRRAAAQALGAMGPAAARLDRLAELLRDGDRDARRAAADALKAMAPAAARPDLLDRLTELLRDGDWYVREAAARALGAMGPAAARPDTLDRLTELLRDGDRDVRRAAVWALGAMGPAADLLDRLAELLRDEDVDVRWAAVWALEAMGPAAARPDLLDRLAELLRDGDWAVRRAAADALKAMAPAAARPDLLDRLAELLRDEDEYVRRVAADALGAMGPAAARPDLLDRLTELLRDGDWYVRRAAALALQSFMRQGIRLFQHPDGSWHGQTVADLSA